MFAALMIGHGFLTLGLLNAWRLSDFCCTPIGCRAHFIAGYR